MKIAFLGRFGVHVTGEPRPVHSPAFEAGYAEGTTGVVRPGRATTDPDFNRGWFAGRDDVRRYAPKGPRGYTR